MLTKRHKAAAAAPPAARSSDGDCAAGRRRRQDVAGGREGASGASLLDARGRRLYLTAAERAAVLDAARLAPRDVRTFVGLLHWSGARISEALAVTAGRVDLDAGVVVLETLKKRRGGVFRAVPVPPELLDMLDLVHDLRGAQRDAGRREARLWPWCRMTAWRRVRGVLEAAGVPEGPHRTAKGLRHGFGVAAVQRVPLNVVSRWMGHASLDVTAIYCNAVGEEERALAARLWE
jgi:integrase/recombinase XerD